MVVAPASGTILSGLVELVLPTGRPDQGMGKGLTRLEAAVLAGQTLGPAGFLHFQGGAEIPLASRASLEAFWRLAWGRPVSQGGFGRLWTPMIEVLGWMDVEAGARPHWDLAPQFQVTLSARQHVALCLAARIPLEPGHDRSVGAWAYLLWEWFDGGLLEGW